MIPFSVKLLSIVPYYPDFMIILLGIILDIINDQINKKEV